MNVIIANKYRDMLKSLNIEIIKSMEGVFSVDEIVNTFSNFYYDKMILDVTAISNYTDLDNLQKLSMNLDVNKIIFVLDDSEQSENSIYLSKLISMGIYNFTRNVEGIKYLLVHPNQYSDVAQLHNVGATAIPVAPSVSIGTTTTGMPVNVNANVVTGNISKGKVNIIGIKNLTPHSGATTLTYLLKKHLQSNYSVVAMEVNKTDFMYFNDNDLISTNTNDLAIEVMKKANYDIVLIDLNDFNKLDICDDVLYLLEPSTLKLNRLIKSNRSIFEKYSRNKIILNKSFIEGRDLDIFESEAGMKMFYNLPTLDDRQIPNNNINGLLYKLNLKRKTSEETSKGGLFGFLRK